VRHDLEAWRREYMAAAGIEEDSRTSPLFRAAEGKRKALTGNRYNAHSMRQMLKRRLKGAGLPGLFSPLARTVGRDRGRDSARGGEDVIIVRYADDAVLGFQHRTDAERFLEQLRERLAKFGQQVAEKRPILAKSVTRHYAESKVSRL
jgi:hypothetical protein